MVEGAWMGVLALVVGRGAWVGSVNRSSAMRLRNLAGSMYKGWIGDWV